MKWAEFKQLDIGQIADLVQKWELGEDKEGAGEFAVDVLDNVILRFDQGTMQETISDTLISVGGPLVLPKVGAKLASFLAAGLHAKPLANLPF